MNRKDAEDAEMDSRSNSGAAEIVGVDVVLKEPTRTENQLARRLIGICIEIHRVLGPGLLESAYEECLAHELSIHGVTFRTQVALPLVYKNIRLECGYRLDFLIEDCLIFEVKAVAELLPIHEAQLLTYLKLTQKRLGLLVNFNVPILKQGIKRLVCGKIRHQW